jgi:hypothetical protein
LEFSSISQLEALIEEAKRTKSEEEFRKSLLPYQKSGFKPLLLLDDKVSKQELISFTKAKIQRKLEREIRTFGSIESAQWARANARGILLSDPDGIEIDLDETNFVSVLTGLDSELIEELSELPEHDILTALNELEVDFTEDDLIHDPYYAAILNIDHEIVVQNTVYKYTEKGIL